jgi:hypothetical protein
MLKLQIEQEPSEPSRLNFMLKFNCGCGRTGQTEDDPMALIHEATDHAATCSHAVEFRGEARPQ